MVLESTHVPSGIRILKIICEIPEFIYKKLIRLFCSTCLSVGCCSGTNIKAILQAIIITVSIRKVDPTKLLEKFNNLDFVFSVERIPNKSKELVTMRIFPKDKESIALKLEEYLFSQKILVEQFNVNRGRLDEVFRELTK